MFREEKSFVLSYKGLFDFIHGDVSPAQCLTGIQPFNSLTFQPAQIKNPSRQEKFRQEEFKILPGDYLRK